MVVDTIMSLDYLLGRMTSVCSLRTELLKVQWNTTSGGSASTLQEMLIVSLRITPLKEGGTAHMGASVG